MADGTMEERLGAMARSRRESVSEGAAAGAGLPAPSPSVLPEQRTNRQAAYDLTMAQLDPAVPLEDHRQALATVQAWFRQAGLSADEARVLVDRFNAAVDPYSRPSSGRDRLAEEARDYLRARWGGDYARNMALAEAAIARLGGEALERFLRESGLRFDPFVLRTLADVAGRSGWADGATAVQATRSGAS